MQRKALAIAVFLCFAFCFWALLGIFVIQPIGAVPDGITIVYWRSGINLPFVASADGFLLDSGSNVSLLGRALVVGKMSETLLEREVFRCPYSESLYLISTGGMTFEQ